MSDPTLTEEKGSTMPDFEKNDTVKNSETALVDGSPRESSSISEKDHTSAVPMEPQTDEVDGGLAAWLHILAGFCLFFNTWGILNTFGVFQTYYSTGQLFTGSSSSEIAWIGAIQCYMLLFTGFLSGPLFDRGYLRYLIGTGSLLVVLGFMMLSICKTFWQCLLAQGFCIGIGSGMLFTPSVSILPQYWGRKVGMALGIAASGSSLGGILYPIVFYRLLNHISFGWSVRVLGFMALATLLIPNLVMKMRQRPVHARALLDTTVVNDGPFWLFTFGGLLGFAGLFTFLFFVSTFAYETKILSASMSFYLIPILNASSTFGRPLAGFAADKAGPLNIFIPGALICGALIFGMTGVHNTAGIVILVLLFGFFSGVFVSLPAITLVSLTKDKSKVGTRIGMSSGLIGLGCLCGGPGGGDLLTRYSHGIPHWNYLWIYGGVACMGGSAIFLGVRLMKTGVVLKAKA